MSSGSSVLEGSSVSEGSSSVLEGSSVSVEAVWEAVSGLLPESWSALPDPISFEQEFLTAMEEGWRDPRFADLDDAALSAAVRGQAAEVAAATCRWLLLVAEVVRRGLWARDGARTPAQWLSHWCSIASPTAREHVRVALRLALFPETAARFARGELSYSKVRAITRLREPGLEGLLLRFASCATGDHLEKIVAEVARQLRGERRRRLDPWERRKAYWESAGEGMMKVTLLVPVDAGEQLANDIDGQAWRAVDQAHEAAKAAQQAQTDPAEGQLVAGDRVVGWNPDAAADTTADTTAAPDGDGAGDGGRGPDPWALSIGQARADVLLAAARAAAEGLPADSSGADKHLTVYHVDAGTLPAPDDAAGRQRPVPVRTGQGRVLAMSVRTLERLACDGRIGAAVHDADGTLTATSSPEEAIPAATRRAVLARDRGTCRFPGCQTRRWLHCHHIVHREHGGPSTMANLVTLCGRHHRFVHDHRWTIAHDGKGHLEFRPPDRPPVPSVMPPVTVHPDAAAARNRAAGLDPPGPDALYSGWDGERPDYDACLFVIAQELDRLQPPDPDDILVAA